MNSKENTKNISVKKSAKKFLPFVLLLLSPLFFACNTDSEDVKHEIQEDAKPIELRMMEKVETDNDFAIDLLKATYKFEEKDNIFISPLSVSMALSMTLNGAEGETLEEMKEALRAKGYSVEDINEYNKSLKKALLEVDKSTELTIANSIWYKDENITVYDDFINVNKDNYDAEIKTLDFSSPDAIKQINSWCAKQTKDKIPEIIKEIPDDALMYLINAIYFKGIWTSMFEKKDTKKEDFYTEGKVSIGKVDMMHQTEAFDYFADEYCRYLRMAYGNKAFSMVVMLPNDDKTVDDVIANLDSERWNDAMEYMSGRDVNLSFPRFKAECDYEMQKKILPDMGMIKPFSEYDADFKKMCIPAPYISRVIHKTFVEVNEEGTEAAAVTAVEMGFTSAMPSEPVIIEYKVNKPFVFAIRENSTGVILFVGKIGKIE